MSLKQWLWTLLDEMRVNPNPRFNLYGVIAQADREGWHFEDLVTYCQYHGGLSRRMVRQAVDRFYSEQMGTQQKQPPVPTTPTTNLPVHKPYPWKDLNAEPHLLILGGTGTGKTTIARWLATQLKGCHLCLDPHATPTKWAGLPVVGLGRDFRTIAATAEAIERLMLSRFQEMAQGREDFPMLNLWIDEYPAIADSGEAGEVFQAVIPSLLREARKTAIRVVILSQGAEVKTLGIEGKGSLRDQLCFVRLGSFALDYCRKAQPELLPVLKEQGRPAMVGDRLALVPDLSQFVPSYPAAASKLPPELVVLDRSDSADLPSPKSKSDKLAHLVTVENWQLLQSGIPGWQFEEQLFGSSGGSANRKAQKLKRLLQEKFG